jgi:hypothetical protein
MSLLERAIVAAITVLVGGAASAGEIAPVPTSLHDLAPPRRPAGSVAAFLRPTRRPSGFTDHLPALGHGCLPEDVGRTTRVTEALGQ